VQLRDAAVLGEVVDHRLAALEAQLLVENGIARRVCKAFDFQEVALERRGLLRECVEVVLEATEGKWTAPPLRRA